MFSADQYELLDLGGGRKLERFGEYILDRPSPAARGSAHLPPAVWRRCSARFQRTEDDRGHWQLSGQLPRSWIIRHTAVRLELKRTDFGHLGVFAEQAPNWDWISGIVSKRPSCRVLNLFGYTGGSTLTAAAAGAEVVHVDAAKNAVAWARRNARHSQLSEAPIRWIVEDATRFVRREVRRGARYDGLILDPPSYGHGPTGEAWKLSRDLVPLLKHCRQLLSDRPVLLLLTCHTPEYRAADLAAALGEIIFGHCAAGVMGRRLSIATADGRKLPCGHMARWPG